ncbi:MAG: acyl-CoA dehydrogenase [Salinisphaeraceae bacterium]|jgi:alkylation response protein AidB-like acyl-CoA dehydrogenase|nr:acyl-CoA dehydrogenase [Salinisphaeraceae bacterium]
MDFSVSEQTQTLLARTQRFVDEELIPLEPEIQKGWWHIEPLLQAKREQVKKLGLWAPNLPQDIGGMGLPLIDLGLMFEVMGQTPIGNYVFGAQAPDAGNMEILHEFGSPEQQDSWLKPLAEGAIRSCFAMTEPQTAGSNPTLLTSRAVRDGDSWVINGHKWFTSCFDGAAFTIAMVVTDDDAERHQRASMIIVPLDIPGIEHVRNISIMGHAGEGYFSHAEIKFHDVRVPAENMLGEPGQGFLIAQKRLGPGRIHHCMRWLGICKRAQKLLCQQALGREVRNGERLADQQTIQNWIAENAAEIEAARCMTLKAAWTGDHYGWKAARTEIGMIKYHCAGILQRVVDRALQAHGSLGMTDDTPLAHWYSHERASRIYDGPDEVHKQKVAQQVLGSLA